MNRLTKKKPNGEYISNGEINTRSQQIAWLRQLGFKIGQLEDLEEIIGIDLITYISALRNGIFVKTENGVCFDYVYVMQQCDCYNEWLSNPHDTFVLVNHKIAVDVRDYKKTWALTKEELEK